MKIIDYLGVMTESDAGEALEFILFVGSLQTMTDLELDYEAEGYRESSAAAKAIENEKSRRCWLETRGGAT